MTQRIITYHIWPRDLAFHELFAWPNLFAEKRGLAIKHTYHQLTVNKHEAITCEDTPQLVGILQQCRDFNSLRSTQRFCETNDAKREFESVLWYMGSSLSVSLSSGDVDLMNAGHAEIKAKFNLRNPPISSADPARAKKVHATIFLGRHFDDEAGHVASKLRKFLSLVGFEVIEGEEFNSQAIPEKVKRRIETQDVYIGLVTGRREHEWITAEAAYAHGKGKHIILIVEDSSGYRPTILGNDFEHIPFKPGFIEQAFVKLLEEFRSVGVSGMF